MATSDFDILIDSRLALSEIVNLQVYLDKRTAVHATKSGSHASLLALVSLGAEQVP